MRTPASGLLMPLPSGLGCATIRQASTWLRLSSSSVLTSLPIVVGCRYLESDILRASRKTFSPGYKRYGTTVDASDTSSVRDGARQSRRDRYATLDAEEILSRFKRCCLPSPAAVTHHDLFANSSDLIGQQVTLHGYITSRRVANKNITFIQLRGPQLLHSESVQCTFFRKTDAHGSVQDLTLHSPVTITGTVQKRQLQSEGPAAPQDSIEIVVDSMEVLNKFPNDIVMKPETVFPPEQRHLQLRNSEDLHHSLYVRSSVSRSIRNFLQGEHGFTEIETPLLFKSTPEGAREFLVPTRTPGMAYALPQSPQQYKQILMASGVTRYMQIAKCFRDEDLRADRQPEFTQIDLEMAFATADDVMTIVEQLIQMLWTQVLPRNHTPPKTFKRMAYDTAMARYGSDKPDVRLGCEITRIEWLLPVDLVGKIGPLMEPIVEVMKIPLSKTDDPNKTREFVSTFMASPAAESFLHNPDGQPGLFIFDSRKPLQGLQVFGFEAAEQVEEMLSLSDGDLVVLQARKNVPFSGGSTAIGNFRLALHKAAVKEGLLQAPEGFEFLWITDFPLFSPSSDLASEPGQGGSAGLSSTHHPFTAPKSPADVDLLLTDPLVAKADHYDLVVNGVELGGGSRRIHVAEMQDLVMRNVLGMSDERMRDFDHLIEVLRAGCPPHAGIALGFDRLIAMMLGKESVRDVIAFPKSGKGEDLLVKSPTKMVQSQLDTYHLKIRE